LSSVNVYRNPIRISLFLVTDSSLSTTGFRYCLY
jgi:hypothetical protein